MAAPKQTAQGAEIMGWAQTWTENRSMTLTLCWDCGSSSWDRMDWDMKLSPITEKALESFAYGSECSSCGVDLLNILADMAEAAQAEHREALQVACESGSCRCAWDAH